MSTLFCIAVPVIILFILLVAIGNANNAKAKALTDANATYQSALRKLKQHPTNADLQQQTLASGRHYASLSRESKGTTIFDEMALNNDIRAATAGASAITAPAPIAAADRLKQLDDLKAQGLISDAEHAQRRAQILAEL